MKIVTKNIIFATEDIIAHGCNCQGKMGSGVAKAIRARWPKAYEAYVQKYNTNRLELGTVQIVYVNEKQDTWPTKNPGVKFIANCMTQQFYGYDSKAYASIDAINSSLTALVNFAAKYNYSVALPPIGCGFGGLSWSQVGPMIEIIFNSKQVGFTIYDHKVEKWKE